MHISFLHSLAYYDTFFWGFIKTFNWNVFNILFKTVVKLKVHISTTNLHQRMMIEEISWVFAPEQAVSIVKWKPRTPEIYVGVSCHLDLLINKTYWLSKHPLPRATHRWDPPLLLTFCCVLPSVILVANGGRKLSNVKEVFHANYLCTSFIPNYMQGIVKVRVSRVSTIPIFIFHAVQRRWLVYFWPKFRSFNSVTV